MAITAASDWTAMIWVTSTGELVTTLVGHKRAVLSASFSSDAQLAITASVDRTAKIWSAESGHCLQTLSGHQGALCSAVFHPKLQRSSAQAFQRVKGEEAFALGEEFGDEIMPIFPVAERRRSGGCDCR